MPKSNRELFSEAIRSANALGWRAIPCVVFETPGKNGETKREKHPLVNWKTYQSRHPTESEIESWCNLPLADFAGVEIVTGKYGPNLWVTGVDFDQRDGKPDFFPYVEDLVDALHTKTASGGYHYYFKHDKELHNATNLYEGNKEGPDTIVDFRGEGGVIVIGPTPLWSHDPRFAIKESPPILKGRYETNLTIRPEELLPLPARFIVAVQAKKNIGNEEWRKIFQGQVKSGSKHTVAMSLIAKLLTGISSEEQVDGARDLVYAIMKTQFAVDPNDPVERDKIDSMFAWVIEKEKRKRSAEYQVAKKYLSEAEDKKAGSVWEELVQVKRAERRDDIVVFMNGAGKSMSIHVDQFFSMNTFRREHALAYKVLLPAISSKRFENFLMTIPVVEVKGESISLEEIIQEKLQDMKVSKEPVEDKNLAKRSAVRSGFSVARTAGEKATLFFSYKRLFDSLREEGIRRTRAEISQVFNDIGVKKLRTKTHNLWVYEFDDDDDEE